MSPLTDRNLNNELCAGSDPALAADGAAERLGYKVVNDMHAEPRSDAASVCGEERIKNLLGDIRLHPFSIIGITDRQLALLLCNFNRYGTFGIGIECVNKRVHKQIGNDLRDGPRIAVQFDAFVTVNRHAML